MQYTNSTHTYYLDKIYTSFPEPETEVYDVIRVTRRANKDLGRLVEVEEVGYINFYVDREFHRTEFSDKAETGDTISRHWKDSYLQSDDGKLTSHAVSLHYLKKERKQKKMEKVISRTITKSVTYQIMTVSPTDGIKMGDLVEWDHEITTAAERDEILESFGIAKGNLIEVDRKEETRFMPLSTFIENSMTAEEYDAYKASKK